MGKRARKATRGKSVAADIFGDTNPIVENGDGRDEGTIDATAAGGGSGDDGSIIDPVAVGNTSGSDASGDRGADGTAKPKRKYTRRAGKTADAISLEIGSFKDLLYSSHAMLAAITQSPLLEIDESEAEKLSKAIANVTRHYNVPAMAQTTVDWIMLIQAAGAVYAPRIIAARVNAAARKQAAQPPRQSPLAPQNVGPSPSAPNYRPPVPTPDSQVKPDSQAKPQPSAGMRHQPGLDTLDGAGLPLKIN